MLVQLSPGIYGMSATHIQGVACPKWVHLTDSQCRGQEGGISMTVHLDILRSKRNLVTIGRHCKLPHPKEPKEPKGSSCPQQAGFILIRQSLPNVEKSDKNV